MNLAVYAEYACNIVIAPRDAVAIYTGNPNISWNPDTKEQPDSSAWNPLGNNTFRGSLHGGNSKWNNNNNWGNNSGW